MIIEILYLDTDPMDKVSIVAGMTYGKGDVKPSRAVNCFNDEHMGVFEHISFTARISGISRACSHQLVRHRLASFVQQSQRYKKIDTSSNDWCVVPDAFDDVPFFFNHMSDCADAYNLALMNGVKPEDARFLLPEATKTNIVMTMNARELFHFLDLRTDRHAQWEIRKMALELMNQLENNGWHEVIELWKKGKCW